MFRILKIIIAAIIAAYFVIFSVSNLQYVTIKPFMNVTSYNIPLFLIIVFSIFIGLLIGAIAMYGENINLKFRIKKQNKTIKNLNIDIDRLKKLTISGNKTEGVSNNETILSIGQSPSTTIIPIEILEEPKSDKPAIDKKDDDIKAALK